MVARVIVMGKSNGAGYIEMIVRTADDKPDGGMDFRTYTNT